MAGKIIQILRQKLLDFTFLGNSGTEKLTLHTALPVANYKSGLLAVRIHTNNIPTGGSFQFRLSPTLPCSTDGRQFTNTSLGVASLTVDDSFSAPWYLQAAISTMTAAFLLIEILATQAATATTFSAQLSADLLLREE